MNLQKIKSIVQDLVCQMVDQEACVEIIANDLSQRNTEIVIGVHPDDIKLVIGKGGKNINAIRTILYAVAAKSNKLCFVVCEKSSLN